MTNSVICSLCKKEAFRKVKFEKIEHDFCVYHTGFIMAIIDLGQEKHEWSALDD